MFPSLPRSESSNGIAYHRIGSGEPIALLHGVGLCAESWHKQIAVLAEAHTVVALDMPGHGHSRGFEQTAPTLSDYTNRIQDCLDEISPHRFIIAGHSMGALIAMNLATAHADRCKAVAALNGVYERSKKAREAVRQRAARLRHDDSGDIAAAPLKRWFGEAPSQEQQQAVRCCMHWLQSVDRQGYSAAYSVFANNDGPTRKALTSMRVPTLFLTGSQDLNSTPAMSQAMASVAPMSKSVVIQNAGHMLLLTHAHDVNQHLRQFCDDITGQCH